MKNKFILYIQNQSLLFLFLLLNFERWDPLNLGFDYLIFKLTFTLLIICFSFSFFKYFRFDVDSRISKYIITYFIILTIISYINSDEFNDNYFDSLFFINLTVFLLTLNFVYFNKTIIYKCFILYSIGAFILSILYIFKIGTEADASGRISIFGENQNSIGVNLCFASLMIFSLVFENKLNLNKYRYLLLLQLPTIFIFIAATGSRLATGSLLISIISYFLLWNSKNLVKKVTLLFLGFFILFILYSIFGSNSIVSDRISESITSGDLGNRDLILFMIIPLMLNNLFFGVGITGYNKQIFQIFDTYTSPHNGIIEVICYTGIIGFIFFMIFLSKSFLIAIKKKQTENELLPLIFFFPIVGILLTAQIFQTKIVWLIFAYIISKQKIIKIT
jgi:O-antigen ligase